MAKPRNPFDLLLSDDQKKTVAIWLSTEVQNALAARSAQESEVEYWHAIYEQARTRAGNLPWADAADLTSWIATEQVDSIHARIMKTMWTEPLCTVSGYGPVADRAPFIEEFHQWKVEEEDLQSYLDKLVLISMIEPRGLIEVSENAERRTQRSTIKAKLQINPLGGTVIGEDGTQQLELDGDGNPIEAQNGEPSIERTVDRRMLIRTGPSYRVLPYRDSLILPGHAQDDDEIWGYAKRIFPRKPDLVAAAAKGIYDKDAVASLTDVGDREPDPALQRSNMDIAPQYAETAEKELWELLWLVDLNNFLEQHNQQPTGKAELDGARWYVVTLHVRTHTLLRLQHDDLDMSRFVPMILLPRTDRATEGFSFIGHKLITVVEEHTAYRNMAADCSAKAVNAPILRMSGALWDPDEQPMGPRAVVDVRDPREIMPLQLPDVPQSVYLNQDRIENAAKRLGGINDIAAGQEVQKGAPTLGEIQMATEQSFVRMDLIVRRAQRTLEKIMQIRHAIWKRTLAEQQTGIDAPAGFGQAASLSVSAATTGMGTPIDQYLPDGKITAALLDGPVRFKAYGSVETADLNRQRNNLISAMQTLPMLMQMFGPIIGPMIQTPQGARAVFREWLRVMRWPNPQAFLGSPSQDLLGQGGAMPGPQVPMMGQPMQPQMGMPTAPGQGVMPPMPMPSPLGPPMPQAPGVM